MSPDSTRVQILAYLKINPSATAGELSHHLELTASDVRYHLSFLISTHQVEVITPPTSQSLSPGRPPRLFRIPLSGHPNNLPALTRALLKAWLASQPADSPDAYKKLAEMLPFPHADAFAPTRPLPRRLPAIMAQLTQANYQPSWEARPQGPCIIYKNCPYAEVWPEFPELCTMDRFLLEKITGRPVTQLKNIDPSIPTATICMFQTM